MTAASRSRIAAGLLTIAAAGHALAIPHHTDAAHGGVLQGAAFAAVALAQLVAAAGMAQRPTDERLHQLVVGGTVVLLALWMASRTVGLPLGPHAGAAEAVGALDAVTVAAQLGAIVVLARRSPRRHRTVLAASFAGLVVGVAALSISDVSTTAEATPHSHAEADTGHHGPSDAGAEAGSQQPTPAPSHEDREHGHGVDLHSHEGAPDHPHP